ncbi:MAG: penicillin-binding transpeptidase domain-containing protein, partial [Dehalococcoidia bacterium]|nr:penicillin-binding transpeptidase domain-containing protein [Dehalococcoidia bacterium]
IRIRFWLLRLGILLMFGVLTMQLWNLQIVNGKMYALRAENNKIREQFTPPPRGVIFDRDRKPLVVNVPTFAVSVMPADLKKDDQAAVAARLAAILKMRPEEVEKPIAQRRLAKRLFDPVIVKSGIPQDTAFMIAERRQELPGVSIIVEPVRQYLGGPVYSHLLGYMGRLDADDYARLKDQGYGINERVGKTGIELSYERELRGVRGRERIVVDVTGAPVGELESIPPIPGHSLVLTIDSDLQNYAARVVTRYMRASKYGVALVVDVQTGELLAMVSVPGYDNNLFTSTITEDKLDRLIKDPGRPLVNHALSENFPPGSIFKLITAAAALQENIATTSTTIHSPGYIELSGYRFPDWGVLGALDFYQAIARSGDVYFYTLGGGYGDFPGLGPERLAAYSRLFGLGERSGIRLPGEVPGNVPTPTWKQEEYEEEWYTGDTYHFAI